MPSTMQAVRFEAFGEPRAQLRVAELPRPEPRAGEVRVRFTHRAINPSDLLTVRGQYGRLPRLPATAGMEGAGRVNALGEGATGVDVGQRVIPLGAAGTWAEYGVVRAEALLPVPDGVSDEQAAQFVVNPVTAWVMVTELLAVPEGAWLLQSAAGSTLGRIVLQLARLRGFRTLNLVRRPEQVAELAALGADAVLCTAEAGWVEQARATTEGQGAWGAIDAVGGATGAGMVSALRPGGTMLLYGLLSGEPIPLPVGEMLFRGTRVEGFWLTHWFRTTPPEQVRRTLGTLLRLMATDALVPPVEASYPLAEVVAAVAHAERPGRSGKVLLVG